MVLTQLHNTQETTQSDDERSCTCENSLFRTADTCAENTKQR
jgi:hypothetical protein